MPIHFALYKNKHIAGEKRYLARVRSIGTLSREAMIERMCRYSTTLTRANLNAAWDLIELAATRALLEGWNVTIPTAILSIFVRGLFESYDDRFDPNRHEFVVNCQADRKTRKIIRLEARPQREHPDEPRPIVRIYTDNFTNLANQVITPGRTGTLQGDKLKFDKDDPRQGIFILGVDGSVTHVEEVAHGEAKVVVFLVPPLPFGFYKIAVRAACGGGEDLDVGYLGPVLHVVPPHDLLLEPPEDPFAAISLRLPE